MSVFEELKQIARREHEHGDLPSWLLTEILTVVDDLALCSEKEERIRALITQIQNYDPYAGAGCFSSSCSLENIRKTVRRRAL